MDLYFIQMSNFILQSAKFIKMMLQKEYDQKLLKAANNEYKYLLGGKRFCMMDSFEKAYDSMGAVKQK